MADFEWLAPGGHKRLVDNVTERLDEKPDGSAYAPDLTAGAALGITGDGPTESAAWLQRVSASDGPTTISSIHGRTLRWNQHGQTWTGAAQDVTYTGTDGLQTVTGTSTGNSSSRVTTLSATIGHKYLVKAGDLQFGSGNTAIVRAVRNYNQVAVLTESANAAIIDTSASPWAAGDVLGIRIAALEGTVCDLSFYPQLFDLTAMFGAGNEPSTIEEFTALYPLPYYEYDAGSLLPVNMTGIESTAADESWTQTRSIDAATYFPTGIKQAGGRHEVFDEITATEVVQRLGSVALSSLTWSKSSSDLVDRYVVAQFVQATGAVQNGAINLVGYNLSAFSNIVGDAFTNGNQLCLNYAAAGTSTLEQFTASLVGKEIYYELATPTVTPIDPPLNMTYRTAAGGTECVMVPTGENSAPPTIVTAQGYTAESLRDAALSAIAPVENGRASTNYGIGSYLVHGGQLCRVTTAIATGEAITIGTNVTATTVMAEVIALIAQ